MKPITILIADMDKEYYAKLKEDLEYHNNFQVIGYKRDGKSALIEINKIKPDVIIIDDLLEIWDGMEILERVQYRPVSIVLSSIYSVKIKNMLLQRGADFVSDRFYNTGELIRIIKKIYYKNQILKFEKENLLNLELLKHIQEILLCIGFKANWKSYKYAKEIILLSFQNRDLRASEIYKIVANKFNITEIAISSGFGNAIERTFANNKEEYYYKLSYNNAIKPTKEEFIDIVLEEILMYFDV